METPQGSLEYILGREGGCVVVTGCSGWDTELRIPAAIEGLPVTVIAKKAFLSRKQLRRVVLPETVEEIGDWAFAYCTNLESVWMPRKKCTLGSRIFMECPGIRRLFLYEGGREEKNPAKASEREEQTAALLAASAALLEAEYLMDPMEAGTGPWLQKWDARMLQMLRAEDGEGYTKMILCGEEDAGSSMEIYLNRRRKSKVRLALLRLMNPLELPGERAQELREYLAAHTRGCESEETWEVILGEHGHEQKYFELFTEIGGITEENFHAVLTDMGNEYAEMKAFLIRYREEKMECKDFFETLSLEGW